MPKILLVEDDEILRKCLSLCLEREGRKITGIASFEGVIWKLSKQPFDLVVTDYNLSTSEDGLSLLSYLHLQNITHRPPAILISGSRRRGLMESAARDFGVYAFMKKPLDLGIFLASCRDALLSASAVSVSLSARRNDIGTVQENKATKKETSCLRLSMEKAMLDIGL